MVMGGERAQKMPGARPAHQRSPIDAPHTLRSPPQVPPLCVLVAKVRLNAHFFALISKQKATKRSTASRQFLGVCSSSFLIGYWNPSGYTPLQHNTALQNRHALLPTRVVQEVLSSQHTHASTCKKAKKKTSFWWPW